MRRVIVGTAGHVDHGKTSLVKALTGIDCDRWEEEKLRGITIDLGFAHLTRGDLQVGFVDVPGHERFLHNALAGLGGIRVLLLVVAADEGVKPQTREHLDVCSLLGIPAAIVALTKADLAGPELLDLAELEVAELLAGGPFAGAEIVPVSSLTGQGMDELANRLLALAGRHAFTGDQAGGASRLPIDRAFHLKGVGVVVTGTLASGAIAPGDSLELLPGGNTVRVRAVQVHGQARERALAGERTSLQLAGVELGELARGLELATQGTLETTQELCARVRWLPNAGKAVKGFLPVRVHCFANEVQGKLRPLEGKALEPGETAVVEIRLSQPVALARGDRLILRRPSPPLTLGGGEVLDPGWRRHRGATLGKALAALSGPEDTRLLFWVEEAGEAGLDAEALGRRLGRPPAEMRHRLAALAGDGKLLAVPGGAGRFLAPAVYRRVADRARRVLKEYFGKNRLATGLPKAEAVQRILPGRGRELAGVYLDWLAAQKVLAVVADQITLPGRSAELTGEESSLAKAVEAAFLGQGLTPSSPQQIASELGAKPQILEGVVGYLVERRRLTRLPGGLVLATAALDTMVAELRQGGWERFPVARFKDHFGLSRKWAIPLLEHLDSAGVTRRVGDDRMVVQELPRG